MAAAAHMGILSKLLIAGINLISINRIATPGYQNM